MQRLRCHGRHRAKCEREGTRSERRLLRFILCGGVTSKSRNPGASIVARCLEGRACFLPSSARFPWAILLLRLLPAAPSVSFSLNSLIFPHICFLVIEQGSGPVSSGRILLSLERSCCFSREGAGGGVGAEKRVTLFLEGGGVSGRGGVTQTFISCPSPSCRFGDGISDNIGKNLRDKIFATFLVHNSVSYWCKFCRRFSPRGPQGFEQAMLTL